MIRQEYTQAALIELLNKLIVSRISTTDYRTIIEVVNTLVERFDENTITRY